MQSLIEKLHTDDESAFETIYHSIHQKIYNFIFRYVQNKASAQELTQLFFVRLWEKRMRLSNEKPLESQAFVMARNLVIDELRKMTREKKFKAKLNRIFVLLIYFDNKKISFSLIVNKTT